MDRDTATIIEMIGEVACAATYVEGLSMTMDQAINLAIGNK